MPQITLEYLERAELLSRQKNPGKCIQFDTYFQLGRVSEKADNYELAISFYKEVVIFSDKAYLAIGTSDQQ